ncbi:hypothetical protein OSB04_001734 [Centaurea solstitialis]|uniref:F-box domain-containing protein n=1 Tax=Centaurea solstitialis TaxID=347529 RepID=A0AA38TRI9_9ASTR|nr:hypothetical protein OSB04_001734 [Centaurea solstitialis]
MTSTSAAEPPSSAMAETRNWLEMPEEIMGGMILQRLGAVEILESAQKVCRTWRRICKDPAMWKVIHMHDSSDDWDTEYDISKLTKQAVHRSCGELIDISLKDFDIHNPTPGRIQQQTIINSIRKRLKAAKGRWVEELPSVLWANRTTPRTATGQTPFSLVYGCEAVLPIESQVPVARHRTIEQNSIDLTKEKAFQKMASQKAMVERYFNKKVKVKVFQLGDYVLRRVFPNTQESNAGKLSIKWEGPYIITKIVGKGAYKISTIEGNEIPRSWNATHLKRYYF